MATPRRENTPLKVYCLEHERNAIERNAEAAGMSTSQYLRAVGAGYPVRSALDQRAVKDLAKVNADQGRLGGLLKAMLKNDERFKYYGGKQLVELASAAVTEILDTQKQLRGLVERVIGK